MPSVPSSDDRRLARFLSAILHWTISGCNTTLCETGRGRKGGIGAIYSIRTPDIQLDIIGARKAARPPAVLHLAATKAPGRSDEAKTTRAARDLLREIGRLTPMPKT